MSLTELSAALVVCGGVLAYCGVSSLYARRRLRDQYERPRRWFDLR